MEFCLHFAQLDTKGATPNRSTKDRENVEFIGRVCQNRKRFLILILK